MCSTFFFQASTFQPTLSNPLDSASEKNNIGVSLVPNPGNDQVLESNFMRTNLLSG